jgi:hypothetical protein
MKQEEITLQELVPWGVLAVLGFLLLGTIFRFWQQRKREGKQRKLKRCCAQCGLWEKIERGEPKYGVCVACGGVTSRGRSRKLG